MGYRKVFCIEQSIEQSIQQVIIIIIVGAIVREYFNLHNVTTEMIISIIKDVRAQNATFVHKSLIFM